jgi:hypothetical protein
MQAAMEKAKALREERKGGNIQEDELTFKPQINQRPAYLDEAQRQAHADSLDSLSANMSNDIFERPLPGKKAYQGSDIRPPLSPNSDALGNEMKKFPSSSRIEYSSSSMTKPSDTRSTYSDVESSESFLSSLRSDDASSSSNKHSRSKKPGWNDDFTSNAADILGGPPPPVKGRPPASGASAVSKTSTPKRQDSSSSTGIAHRPSKTDWINDWNSSPEPYSENISSSTSTVKTSPRSVMTQARSRLSLLKSKIRQSESGQGSRSSSSEMMALEDRLPLTRESSVSSISSNISQARPSMNSNTSTSISPRSTRVSSSYIPPPSQQQQPQYQQPMTMTSASSPMMMEEDDYIGEMIECPDCNRRFNPSSFEKHAKICAKVFLQKRKVFDSKKMRVADNPELVNILKKSEKMNGKKTAASQSSAALQSASAIAANNAAAEKAKWKDQSNAFREAMKAARMVSKAIATGAPLPPPKISAPDPSLIPCPHCGRRFNEKAAERHIPKCSDIIAKPSVLKKGSNRSAAAGVGAANKIQGKGARF